jgi:S-ribosylhomocysteine lyase LuxS involved in autoinducer biosynthesis
MPRETAEHFATRIANLVDFKKFVAELRARDCETAEEMRLEEAERIYTNWNVADRDFDKWLEHYVAKLLRAVKGESNAKE